MSKTTVLCQRVYIDAVITPTESWSDFRKIFFELQKECRTASRSCISICNIYASHKWDSDIETANKYIEEHYNRDKLQNALYAAATTDCLNYSGNIGSVSREIYKKYFSGANSYERDILRGKKNPPMTFTESMPIPLKNDRASVIRGEQPRYFTIEFPLLSKKGKERVEEISGKKIKDGRLRFSTNAKQDYVYEVLENIASGNYKICGSQLKYGGDKKGKSRFVLLLSYEKPVQEKLDLDPDRVLGVDLGVKIPAMCALNCNDYYRKSLGGNYIIFQNMRQEKINKNIQKHITYESGDGHGRKRKLKGYDGKGHKINNRNQTFNFTLSRRVVEQALQQRCATIQMEDLSGITGGNSSRFLKNWTYYDLQQKIENRAKEYGITVKKVNPRNTSRKCSKCGYISADNRLSQSEFSCIKCGYRANADFNAARNIAMSGECK